MIDPTPSLASTSLHATAGITPSGSGMALVSLLVFGGLASAALAGLGVVAFSRRRSRSYLLITLALACLLAKALLGGLWIVQLFPIAHHHLLEHGLDLSIAVLLIAAVYDARTAPTDGGSDAEDLG